MLNAIYDSFAFAFANHNHSVVAQWYLNSVSPSSLLDWKSAYSEDVDTNKIRATLRTHKSISIPAAVIQNVHTSYRNHIKKGHIVLLGEKLLLFKPINMDTKFISLILVPLSICRKLFDHYYAGPSGGHMGEYKTLYRLRLRFFWPGLRKMIKNGLHHVYIMLVTMFCAPELVSYIFHGLSLYLFG